MDTDNLTGSPAVLQNVFAYHALHGGERIWCIYEGREYTYAEINRRANQLAHALRDDLGVKKGDVVPVCMASCSDFFVAMFALHRLGAVHFPCNKNFESAELQGHLANVNARVVICDGERLPMVQLALPQGGETRSIIVCGQGDGTETSTLDDLLVGRPGTMPDESAGVGVDDFAMLLLTSGTTGPPRGVMLSQGNLMTTASTLVEHFRWHRDDRYLHFFPNHHANGGYVGIVPAVLSGCTIAMAPSFDALRFGQMLVENKVTYVSINAKQVREILQSPVTEFDHAHDVRRMLLGLNLSPELIEAFEQRFGVRLMSTFGLTESLGINVVGDLYGVRRPGSAGRVLRGYTLRVVDRKGEPVQVNEPGEATLRTHHRHGLAMGYYKGAGQSAEAFGEWLRTDDIVRVDEDGFVWFLNPKIDMMVRDGAYVNPGEIEEFIQGIPGVREVAVVGFPDGDRGDAIVAYVVREENASVDVGEILRQCNAQLDETKQPRFVEFLEALPRTFIDKIERSALRQSALSYRSE